MFVHLPVYGLLCCFCLLVLVTNVALNMVVKDSLESLLSVLWGIYPGVELLDHDNSIFNFLRDYHAISHVTVPLYIPTSKVEVFQFLHKTTSAFQTQE